MTPPDPIAMFISIIFMAATIVVSAGLVLRIRPLPYVPALLIATVANLLGKLFVSVLHWPGAISYSLPTVAFPSFRASSLSPLCRNFCSTGSWGSPSTW